MNITLTGIVAMEPGRGIGINNRLPWNIKQDLRFFKTKTQWHPILMGRSTYESLGAPLPNRQNIVLTSKDYIAEDVLCIKDISELSNLDLIHKEVMVIGGARLFQDTLPLLDKLYVSLVHKEYKTDRKMPLFENHFSTSKLLERFRKFDLLLFTK